MEMAIANFILPAILSDCFEAESDTVDNTLFNPIKHLQKFNDW